MFKKISEMAEAMTEELVACRRDLHKYAEPGWCEIRTATLIARKLTDMGYKVLVGEAVIDTAGRMGVPKQEVLDYYYEEAKRTGADTEFIEQVKNGYTGVMGILECGPGPVTALRFDIDALGVQEALVPEHRPYAEGFASIHKGAMHACGHDGHATIGLGVAKVLMALKEQLCGTIKLIFQPAEEGVRGARSIVEKGHLDDVGNVLACHITGRITEADEKADFNVGFGGCLATSKLDVYFTGKAAHASGFPEAGHNALLAATVAAQNIYSIPRHSKGTTRLNVGKLIAGSGRNVIADQAFMEIEVRGATTEINDYVEAYARRIIKAAAEMHECTAEIELAGTCFSLESDLPLMERLDKVAKEMPELTSHPQLRRQSTGSEDFAYMMGRVQSHGGMGSMVRILCKTSAVAHNNKFDFDDYDALPKAVKILAAGACDLNRKNN